MSRFKLNIETGIYVQILVIWLKGAKARTARAYVYQTGGIAFRGKQLHFSKSGIYFVSQSTGRPVAHQEQGDTKAVVLADLLGETPFKGDLPEDITFEVISRKYSNDIFLEE